MADLRVVMCCELVAWLFPLSVYLSMKRSNTNFKRQIHVADKTLEILCTDLSDFRRKANKQTNAGRSNLRPHSRNQQQIRNLCKSSYSCHVIQILNTPSWDSLCMQWNIHIFFCFFILRFYGIQDMLCSVWTTPAVVEWTHAYGDWHVDSGLVQRLLFVSQLLKWIFHFQRSFW